jgi:LysM repeat protein
MARKETPTRKMDKQVEERLKESGRIGVAESKKAGKKRKRFKFARDKSGRLRAQLGKKPGSKLSGSKYKIRRGDTLSGIAKRLGTTVKKLMAMNPQIKDANKIRAGATINIRGTKPSVKSKAASGLLSRARAAGQSPFSKGFQRSLKGKKLDLFANVSSMPKGEKGGDRTTVIDEKSGTNITAPRTTARDSAFKTARKIMSIRGSGKTPKGKRRGRNLAGR